MEATRAPATSSEDLIYQMAAAPMAGGRARRGTYFAARLSGLFVSRDEGRTWRSAYQTLNLGAPLPTLAVAVAAGRPRQTLVFAGYNGGVLRSLDGGTSWQNCALREPAPAVIALAVSPVFRQDRRVFAGTLEDGMFYSIDGGDHWQTGNLGLIDVNVLCLGISPTFAADQTIFAGTHSGLFVSRNAGRAWREVNLPNGYAAVISLGLSPNFASDGILFAGTETSGLLRSTDMGRHWQRLGQAALSNAINQIVLGTDYPRQPQLLALHDGRVSTSDDDGATWRPGPAAIGNTEPLAAVLAPQGFGAGAPMWLGLEHGPIIRVEG